MAEVDLLRALPKGKRNVTSRASAKTAENIRISKQFGEMYFDGPRELGYGGYRYDGRWVPIAENMCREYKLNKTSKVLQVGSEKGFLLHDLLKVVPGIGVNGTEPSKYARETTLEDVKPFVVDAPYNNLPFPDTEFDLVLALGPVYTLNLGDAIQCLLEIQRVSRGTSFITLASYTNEEEYWLLKHWTLLGATILRRDEWIEILDYVGYTGDYKLTGAASLNLTWACDS